MATTLTSRRLLTAFGLALAIGTAPFAAASATELNVQVVTDIFAMIMPQMQGLQVQFINTPNCQGLVLDSELFPTSIPGNWQHVEHSVMAPNEAQSALLWLLVAKPDSSSAFKVEFDEIRFAAE